MAKVNEAPLMRFRMPPTSNEAATESVNDPNQWFAERWPEQAEQYGPAFLEGTWVDGDGLKRWVPAYLNDDFFSAILGENRSLGHQVVYFPAENAWYFYDFKVDAFCPTTEAKLKLLLSNFLIRCSQECGSMVDVTNLVVKFRQDDVLQGIVVKARALLEADRSFFEGKDGKRRYVDGKIIDANEEPSYAQFVKKAIVREPASKLTVGDAFHRYYQFCKDNAMKPLTRPDFKELVAEVIREEFKIGLRHDVPTESGKQGHGWHGVRLNVPVSIGQN